MPTNKERIYVTFNDDLFDLLESYMEDHYITNYSRAVRLCLSQFLHEYMNVRSFGVTLFSDQK